LGSLSSPGNWRGEVVGWGFGAAGGARRGAEAGF